MSDGSRKFSSLLTGFLIGGIVGSAIAMLYTPLTGKKLRKTISKKTNKALDNINDYIETGKNKTEDIRDKAEDLIKDGKKKAETLISDAKKIVSN